MVEGEGQPCIKGVYIVPILILVLLFWIGSRKMYCALGRRGQLRFGNFNARVGRSVDVDNAIGMFGEDTSGNSPF